MRVLDIFKLREDQNSADNDELIDIEGIWDYECRIIHSPNNPMEFHFPKEENKNIHGGQCTINIGQNNRRTTKIFIKGTRTWNGVILESGETKIENINPREWSSHDGAFTDVNEILYRYIIKDEPLVGITFAKIKKDGNSKLPILEGDFYYLPDKNLKTADHFDLVRAVDEMKHFCTLVGKVTLKNLRK